MKKNYIVQDMEAIIEKEIEGYENAILRENEETYFIDLRTGMGEAEYLKSVFTLDEAIADQINMKIE